MTLMLVSVVILHLIFLSWPKECNSATGHWHTMMLMLVSMTSHDQNSHVAPDFDCLQLRNAMVPLMILSAFCNANASTSGIIWPKTIKNLISIIMTYGMQWCHWWSCWHHLRQMLMPLASHDQYIHIYLCIHVCTCMSPCIHT